MVPGTQQAYSTDYSHHDRIPWTRWLMATEINFSCFWLGLGLGLDQEVQD